MRNSILLGSLVLVVVGAASCAGGADTNPTSAGGDGGSGNHSGAHTSQSATTSDGSTATSGSTGGSTSSAGGGEGGGTGGTGGAPPTSSTGAGGSLCVPGSKTCAGTVLTTCDDNNVETTTDCAATSQTCATGLGCAACDPDARTCAGGIATECTADGSTVVTYECDALQGETCDPDGCNGACTPPNLGHSYIGCEYWPTVTLNPVSNVFDFAVAVGNTSAQDATVTITRGATTVSTTVVTAHTAGVITLPWDKDLKGGDVNASGAPPDPGPSTQKPASAFRLRSTRPVTVYQFSALQYSINPAPTKCPNPVQTGGGIFNPKYTCYSYSNDASLLLPTNVLTGSYTVMSWPSLGTQIAGFAAITATADNTQVTSHGLGAGKFVVGGSGTYKVTGIDANGNGTVTLNRGDVLQLVAAHTGSNTAYGPDITGTGISSDKPVQVIGGNSCAYVPTATTGFCDHLEEAMFPNETLGQDYLVTFPTAPGIANTPHVVRVAATVANTTITFDPPSVSGPVVLASVGDFKEVTGLKKDVRVTSDHPVIVAQYMEGSQAVSTAADGPGDPSQSLCIATAQYRDTYLFVTSKTYDHNYVNITAPMGATITLDGANVTTAFAAIGSSGYGVARVQLDNTKQAHNITGDQKFGIVVYGYGDYTSFMYPGGLNLDRIGSTPGG